MQEVTSEQDAIATALIKVAQVRYAAFRERFGREPRPDEPLLFDPAEDQPTAANHTDRTLQIISAAMLSNVDARLVLDYLGFAYQQ
jgi:hypothetical protein